MLWVVLVTTVVTILRFTTFLPQQLSALSGFYCGRYATVLLKVLATASAVVPIILREILVLKLTQIG